MTPEQAKALEEYRKTVKDYTSGSPDKYQSAGNLILNDQGRSGLGDIVTDPRYKDHEMEALRQLEDQSKNGFNASDMADIAKTENLANRANHGRIESIRQNMQMRGLGGSGLDLMAQVQSAQDANETEALKALEREGMMTDRKNAATQQMGALSAQFQGQDFQQAAAKAQAQDEINRFNTANRNQASTYNMQNTQNISNQNIGTANDWRDKQFGAQAGMATKNYDAATDDYNMAQARKAEKARKKAGMWGGVLGTAGAVAGGIAGASAGPAGIAAGASLGGSAGNAIGTGLGGMARGGMVPGFPVVPGDDPENDMWDAELSPGEIVLPRSVADDPMESARFVAAQHKGYDPDTSKAMALSAKAGPVPNSDAYASKPMTLSPRVQAELEKRNPSLLQAYREKMGQSDDQVKSAQNMQGYIGAGNAIAGQLTDLANSQKDNRILANRWQDMGKRPDMIEAERKGYDGSALDRLGEMNVKNAKDQRAVDSDQFFKEQQLGEYDTSHDPSSGRSKTGQLLLKNALATQAREAEIAGDPAGAARLRGIDVNAVPDSEIPALYNGIKAGSYKDAMDTVAKLEEAKAKRDQVSEMRASRVDDQTTKAQRQAFEKTHMSLASARSAPAVSQAEKDLYAAEKADSLAGLYPNPDKMPMEQVRLLASEVGKIASGGTPSMHELQGITPDTLMGKMSGVTSNFLNNPTPANAGAFIKNYQAYTGALKKDAQKVIGQHYGRIIRASKPHLAPDDYDNLMQQYVGRFDEEAGGEGSMGSSRAMKGGDLP